MNSRTFVNVPMRLELKKTIKQRAIDKGIKTASLMRMAIIEYLKNDDRREGLKNGS